MTPENDRLLSCLTVRLSDESDTTIGTGVLLYQSQLKDKVYVITAAHCLFSDKDEFQNILPIIKAYFYDYVFRTSKCLSIQPDEVLLYKDINRDIAVLCFDKANITDLISQIPAVSIVRDSHGLTDFVVKGFPNATEGREIAVIYPTWIQSMTEVDKFQLQLHEDYGEYAIKGFSGGGIFFESGGVIFLVGIFARFRPEENGKVIYCQYLRDINELLKSKFLPQIKFSFIEKFGLTPNFFKQQVKTAISNLGERYSEVTNLRLPIAQRFSDICIDNQFKKRFMQVFDTWLSYRSQVYNVSKTNAQLNEIETSLGEFHDCIEQWVKNIELLPDIEIDVQWIFDEINEIEERVESNIAALYELAREEEEKIKPDVKKYDYRMPYTYEIDRLREIRSVNHKLVSGIRERVNIKLANIPLFIIKGEAGCGKSHMLGDIADSRSKDDLPTLLLLGQHFNDSDGIEKNILGQLGFNCSFIELLVALNSIGHQVGSRVLLLIDAINESMGTGLWQGQLSGFIEKISEYPFIALTITIRDTYFETIIPEVVRNNPQITFYTHEGFQGNEYAALKMFCEVYKLEQPKFPILAPEFSNPLFLKLICIGIANTKDKVFPNGHQGINKIYNYYITALNKKLRLRSEYALRSNLIEDAIKLFACECYKKSERSIKVSEAVNLFDTNLPKPNTLLLDLIQEGVFNKNLRYNYKTEQSEEEIYFAYERFGDFYIANELLSGYSLATQVIEAFKDGNDLSKLVSSYKFDGIFEALTILLPEKFNLEIFEVLEWKFIADETNGQELFRKITECDHLNHFLLRSLKWRNVESINDAKLTTWIRSDNFRVGIDQYLFTLIELSSVPNHPFNSDRLYRFLNSYVMPERDGFWQKHIRGYSTDDGEGDAFPLRRLIDWAWTPDISYQTDHESARLTGQTLAWLLASTITAIRDQATKALVNLLEQQPDALISLLEKFKGVDDPYIVERLYSVAYGCILRTEQESAIKKIAQFVYDTVFKKRKPPVSILLRDYARNTIEYAIYKKIDLNIKVELIRPPYKSKLPVFPTQEDVSKYWIEHGSKEYKADPYSSQYNHIYHEVIEWDFGKKILEPMIDDFASISFTQEPFFKVFIKELKNGQRRLLNSIIGIIEMRDKFRVEGNGRYGGPGEVEYKAKLEEFNKIFDMGMALLAQKMDKNKFEFLKNSIISYLTAKKRLRLESHYSNCLDPVPIKRWLVDRVFKIGYNTKLHGQYDSLVGNYSRHEDTRKISEKYQYIAMYEILAILTDNYKMIAKGYWSNTTKYQFYKGAWQFYIRDVDPAYVTRKNENIEDSEKESMENYWWSQPQYSHWNISNAEWAYMLPDLPAPKDCIVKNDEDNNEWLNLEDYIDWEEPKPIGEEKYLSSRKRLVYWIQAYLIRKKDKTGIITYLKDKNFYGGWMPENRDSFSSLINREKFWSPAYIDEGMDVKWQLIENTKYKIIVATTNANGSIEADKSGANSRYNIPCQPLFEGMGLEYMSEDGKFKEATGEVIAIHTNTGAVLIKKNKLFDYLNKNNLDIFWTLSGQKTATDIGVNRNRDYHYFQIPCGIFYFERGFFTGKLNMHSRD